MKPRILFIGGTPRGFALIKMLINDGEKVIYAYIMRDDEHEEVKVSDSMEEFCKEHNISSEICKKITTDQISCVLKFKPDLAFVCGWRTVIPPALYNETPIGCIAAHDSLLPEYRGFAPLNWAIINGEKQTGVTLFKICDGIVDSGEIFGQKMIEIGSNETASDVYSRIIDSTVELYKEFLAELKNGTLKSHKQDEDKATYTCKRLSEDGEIDWNKPAVEVFNLIRALSYPYPCAWTIYKGKKILIDKASLPKKQLSYTGNIPGRVVSILNDGVLVLCGTGQIVINNIITSRGKHLEANKIFSSIAITLGK